MGIGKCGRLSKFNIMWVNTSYVHIGVNVLIFLLVNVLLLSLAVAAYISWKSKTFFNARNLKSGWFSARGVPEYDGPERRLIGKSIHLLHYTKEIYSKTRDKRMVGFQGHVGGVQSLMINDLDLVRRVLIEDFDHFVDRWERVRYGNEKLNHMMHVVTGAEVEAKELCGRYTVQSIANIGFGFEANTFNAAQTLEFFNMTKRIMPREYRFDMWEVAKWLLVTYLPLLGKIFGFLMFFDKGASDYFFNIIKEQIVKRKGRKEKRNDMTDLLTEALIGQSASDKDVKQQVESELEIAKPKRALAIDEDSLEAVLTSNLLLLFLLGYDQTSTVMAACMFFLARDPLIQERIL